MLYTFAHTIWKTAWRVWSGFIVLLIITFLPNLLLVTDDPSKTLFARLMQWLFLLAAGQIAILSILGLLAIVTFTAGIITALEYRSISSTVLRAYLRRVIEDNQGLRPEGTGGFAQQSALISVNVPLDDIFIHLYAYSDRPMHDRPEEQQRLLKENELLHDTRKKEDAA